MEKITSPYPVASMLADASEKIEAIKTASGFPENAFRHLCMPLIESFALNVQHLPLSDTLYREIDGAWNFGLTSAMVALRFANSQMFFPTAQSEERRILEPQCHFAAFASTLASCITLISQNSIILSNDKSAEYHSLITPGNLFQWLQKNPNAILQWRKASLPLTPMENAAIASKFIPNGLLINFDLRVALMIFGAINPQLAPNGIESTLAKVVRMSTQKVLAHNADLEARRYRDSGTSAIGSSSSVVNELAQDLINANSNAPIVNPLDASGPIVQTAPSAQSEVSHSDDEVTADSLFAKAKPALREWFTALTKHERYPDLKNQLVVTDKGIEIPVVMLGSFGVQAAMVRTWMDEAGMINGRTANARGIIVSSALKSVFFGAN